MFDIGWSEMAVIAVIALIVIGPRDLPKVMRVAGQWAAKARRVVREFQGNIDQMVREAEVDEIKKEAERIAAYDVKSDLEQSIDPTGDLARAVDPNVPDPPAASGDETSTDAPPAETPAVPVPETADNAGGGAEAASETAPKPAAESR